MKHKYSRWDTVIWHGATNGSPDHHYTVAGAYLLSDDDSEWTYELRHDFLEPGFYYLVPENQISGLGLPPKHRRLNTGGGV